MSRDVIDILRTKIRELQDLVGDDPEDTLFHGQDIKSGKGIFGILHTDLEMREKWNGILFSILDDLEFKICGIVLDKKEYKEKYGSSALHPYHYCLNLLTEQYLRFLEKENVRGDIMAESRGKKEDRSLTEAFNLFYIQGNQFYSAERIQKSITSRQIKLRTKSHAILGLILSDLLALAVKFDVLETYGRVENGLRENFTRLLSKKIQGKYLSGDNNMLRGYGKKLV